MIFICIIKPTKCTIFTIKKTNKMKIQNLLLSISFFWIISCNGQTSKNYESIAPKDFSDKNQEKFTLVKARKNSIKANVFQIMAFSKKKHNPMGTLIFLIIFSYVPLIVMAVMERIKSKKIEQMKNIKRIKNKQ